MKYAIELYYDEKTEEQLYSLAKCVADAGLSTKFMEWGTRPHLTLACFNDVDEEKCIEQLKMFAQFHGKMPAYIASVGMFNDTKAIFAWWKVRNVGEEAERRNCVRGQIEKNVGKKKCEHSDFQGSHYVECYIIRNNVCVASQCVDVPIGKDPI